jgi:hypothetical protein
MHKEGGTMDEAIAGNWADKDGITLEKRFELLREQICHEDGLINQRLNWLLLSQAFLFAGFVSLITTEKSLNLPNPMITPEWLLLGICIAGGWLNYLSFIGLRAAYQSLKHLREDWLNLKPKDKKLQKLYESFPQITWVGDKNSRAIMTASGTPIVITSAWALLAWAISPVPLTGWGLLFVGGVVDAIMFVGTRNN